MFSANSSQVSNGATYIEDVFSTYLYTGTGSAQTITNGIDLSGQGGMVFIKDRTTDVGLSVVHDTNRGPYKRLSTNLTNAEYDYGSGSGIGVTSFNSNGFSLGTGTAYNGSGDNYVSWTFRKKPKFFDIVTWTGDGTNRSISHNLGSVPGCFITKRTDSTGSWVVYHTSLGAGKAMELQTTGAAFSDANIWNNTAPTSTAFSVGATGGANNSGATYVAYLFAHNAGGFGLTGTDNVISCGSFTTDGSGNATVTLGYEPQWMMLKTTGSGGWFIRDTMRGFVADTSGTSVFLTANTSNAESSGTGSAVTATGTQHVLAASTTYIYIAIRRGPMKTPTSGTSVYNTIARTSTGATATVTGVGFPPDLAIAKIRNGTLAPAWNDRLRGAPPYLLSTSTGAEYSPSDGVLAFGQDGVTLGADVTSGYYNISGGYSYINWYFRRAPGFFDEVCYTGDGNSPQVISHNLGVAPELIIVKKRNAASTIGWLALHTFGATTAQYNVLNATDARVSFPYSSSTVLVAKPTATSFLLGGYTDVSGAGNTYAAYLFATCPGVSKVGTYSGTGATQTISCGFTGGARFVLIKRTDTTGDWYVWDTARGMVAGTDPSLLLNSTAAEVTANSIYTTTGGFQIVSTAAGINASGGTYIYLAIA